MIPNLFPSSAKPVYVWPNLDSATLAHNYSITYNFCSDTARLVEKITNNSHHLSLPRIMSITSASHLQQSCTIEIGP